MAAALAGVYIVGDADGPVTLGPDTLGPKRVPFWLRREAASEFARAAAPINGATPRLICTRELTEELLPGLQQRGPQLWLCGPDPELVDPARLALDLGRYVKLSPAPRTASPRPAPGLGHRMLDDFIQRRLAPALKQRGFIRSGAYWYLRGIGVWGMLILRRSKANVGDACTFTFEAAVSSDRIRHLDGTHHPGKPPRLAPAEDESRLIGDLLQPRRDVRWTFEPGCDPDQMERENAAAILGPALSFLRRLRSHEALRDEWLRLGRNTGLGGIHLAVMLHDLGPREPLPALLESIRADARASRWDYAEALIRRVFEQDRSGLTISKDAI